MSNLFDYSATPGSNNSAPPDGAPEGQAPSSVNNVIRQMMANMVGAFTAYTAGGTADVQTVTMDPALSAYSTAVRVAFIPVANNTGACTLNVNGLGAKSIKMLDGSDPPADALNSSAVALVQYDGTNFVLLSAANLVTTNGTQTLTNKTIDGDNNTISNLAHGAEVDNPSSGVHGVAGSVVGTTDTQTLTNKTIAVSQITELSNLTAAEGAQLENIGTTTISATQWGYLGGLASALLEDNDLAANGGTVPETNRANTFLGIITVQGDFNDAQFRLDNTTASGQEWALFSTDSGNLNLSGNLSGVLEMTLTYAGGAQFGAPTGGDQGAGTVNAQGLFVNADPVVTDSDIGSTVQAQGAVLDDLNTLGAATADGQFVVATGAGAFAYESGATARSSLGLGTADSPQFTGIELGHASDTTITRSSAGVIAVEGNRIPHVVAEESFSPGGDLTGTAYAKSIRGNGGDWISVHFPVLTHSSASTANSSAGALPAAYRPPSDTLCTIVSGTVVTTVTIQSNGNIQFGYKNLGDASAFSSTSTLAEIPFPAYFVPD